MFDPNARKPDALKIISHRKDQTYFVEPLKIPGLEVLRVELATRLRPFSVIENAYLPKLGFQGIKDVHNALLFFEREPLSFEQNDEIATACSDLIALSFFFSRDLPQELLSTIKAACRPLYIPDLLLFECPLVVKRGTTTKMPSTWPMGVSFWYVAAKEKGDAFIHAYREVEEMGFEFIEVFRSSVTQIDPAKWSDEFVKMRWRDYKGRLPTQAQVEIGVATGSALMGPIIGPISTPDG